MTDAKKTVDWAGIERDYTSTTRSIREIAAWFQISDTAIRKQAKAKGWVRKAGSQGSQPQTKTEPAVAAPKDPPKIEEVIGRGRNLIERLMDELPQGDGFKAINCSFEGYRSFGVRGTDQVRVLSATASTIVIPWFRSHQFGSSGTVRVNGAAFSYTGLSFTAGTPDTLTFTGVSPSAAGVAAGAALVRGQDYDDSGVGEMEVVGTYLRGLTHASLRFPTDAAFSDRFDSPSAAIEVSGAKVRGVHFRALIGHPRDELFAFLNDAATVTFGGYAEAKDITGTSAACGVAALSLAAKEAGIGGVPYPVGEASNIQFEDTWDQPLAIDTSPAWRPQNSVGRFGNSWNLCSPNGGINRFYDKRSRDGIARRVKAPGTLGATHALQWVDSSGNVRKSFTPGNRWIFSSVSYDTTAEPAQNFNIINNGGFLAEAWNNASSATVGFRARNSTGSADFIADTTEGAAIRVDGTTRFKVSSSVVRPGSDNSQSLGTGTFRWTQLFAQTPTINTSDARAKQGLSENPEVIVAVRDVLLDAWDEVEWVEYRFNEAVAEKGHRARIHFGLIAQRVRDVFAKHDLDPFAFGLLCYDEWEDQFEDILEEVEARIVHEDVGDDGAVIETVEIITVEKATGEQRLIVAGGDRFGIRYEEAFALEAAYQRRELKRLRGG
jgi:hypothetical protein